MNLSGNIRLGFRHLKTFYMYLSLIGYPFKLIARIIESMLLKFSTFLWVLLWIFGCILNNFSYAASEEDEQLKALFLYNFANFVEWPVAAFDTPSSPLRLCLIGPVAFSSYLRIFDQTMIRDRELRIFETSDISSLKNGCHILFVGEDYKNELNSFMLNNEHQFVLSISTIENFVEEGGVVTIFRNEDQVQFDVNLSAALENGLFISSDLLSLARIIKQEPIKK